MGGGQGCSRGAAALPVEPAASERPFPGSGSKLPGTGQAGSAPRPLPLSARAAGRFCRRPSWPGLQSHVRLRGPPARPRTPLGLRPASRRRPRDCSPAHATRPPLTPSPGFWKRPAAPPPLLPALAPPPRSRNCTLPGPFPRLLRPPVWRHFRLARLRAGVRVSRTRR